MGKDIFISYRREGGEHLALLIYHQLRYDGYSVFLDVESLRKGKFDEALFERIREARDFILILPPRGLDRCASPDDWVRQEIEFAIGEKKNIIPIMMEGFENWPAELPETMAPVRVFNGLRNHQGYFGDMIRKLEKGFLESSPRMQAAPGESAEDEGEILEKCQQCGSDSIVCEDPLPTYLWWLRTLRRAIYLWICLAPFAFVVIMMLGAVSEADIQGLQQLGFNLEFLLNNPMAKSIEFGPESLLYFAVVMASLLLLGNTAYKFTGTQPILAKESTSRAVTVTCKRCATKRRIQVSAEVLPSRYSENSHKFAGFMLFAMATGLGISCYSILTKLNVAENSEDRFVIVLTMLGFLALGVGYIVSRINAYLNGIPEKTFRNYLKEEFPVYQETKTVEVNWNEDEFDYEFPDEPPQKVRKNGKKG